MIGLQALNTKEKAWLTAAVVTFLLFALFTTVLFRLIFGNSLTEQIPWYEFKYCFEAATLIIFLMTSLIIGVFMQAIWLRCVGVLFSVLAILLLGWHSLGMFFFCDSQPLCGIEKYIKRTRPSILEVKKSPDNRYNAVIIAIPSGGLVDDSLAVEVQPIGVSKHPCFLTKHYFSEATGNENYVHWKDSQTLVVGDKEYRIKALFR